MTHPLDEALSNLFGGGAALLQVAEEDGAVEALDVLHVAEQDVRLAVQLDRHQLLELRVEHLVPVALSAQQEVRVTTQGGCSTEQRRNGRVETTWLTVSGRMLSIRSVA